MMENRTLPERLKDALADRIQERNKEVKESPIQGLPEKKASESKPRQGV